MRVLITEDDVTTRLLLTHTLEEWGYDLVVAEDGAEAWEVLQADDAPRLVVLNWMMPGMAGTEVCRRVRESDTGNSTYVILLTARGKKEDIVQGLEAGANDYIIKPFEWGELRARMASGVRVLELQEQLREAERTRALMEAAGAAAHEINQPLTVLTESTELLLERSAPDDPHREAMATMVAATQDIAQIVQKMAGIRRYVTKPYLAGIDIVDFDAATEDG